MATPEDTGSTPTYELINDGITGVVERAAKSRAEAKRLRAAMEISRSKGHIQAALDHAAYLEREVGLVMYVLEATVARADGTSWRDEIHQRAEALAPETAIPLVAGRL